MVWDHPELSGPKEAWFATRISQTCPSYSSPSFGESDSTILPGAEAINLGIILAPCLSLFPTSHLSSDPVGSPFKILPEPAHFSLPPLAGARSPLASLLSPLSPRPPQSQQPEGICEHLSHLCSKAGPKRLWLPAHSEQNPNCPEDCHLLSSRLLLTQLPSHRLTAVPQHTRCVPQGLCTGYSCFAHMSLFREVLPN